MPKPLIVTLGGQEFPLALDRVERSDLYGYVEIETQDEKGRVCTLATLADDGRTIIGTSGSAQAMLTPDGKWIERKELIPTGADGKAITPVASSYAAPVPLEKRATIDEYLSYNIRSVYQIGVGGAGGAGSGGDEAGEDAAAGDAVLAPLLAELKKGTIFQFPYSFRGGLEPDAAFLLLAADGTPCMAIGTPTKLEFIGLEQTAPADEGGEGDDGEEADLDFSMI